KFLVLFSALLISSGSARRHNLKNAAVSLSRNFLSFSPFKYLPISTDLAAIFEILWSSFFGILMPLGLVVNDDAIFDVLLGAIERVLIKF
ncbi:MAG: hypothetical protein AAF441_24355, partial [Pseudomonadota bacterium]